MAVCRTFYFVVFMCGGQSVNLDNGGISNMQMFYMLIEVPSLSAIAHDLDPVVLSPPWSLLRDVWSLLIWASTQP